MQNLEINFRNGAAAKRKEPKEKYINTRYKNFFYEVKKGFLRSKNQKNARPFCAHT